MATKVDVLLELKQNIDTELDKAKRKLDDFTGSSEKVKSANEKVAGSMSGLAKGVVAAALAYVSLKTAQAGLRLIDQASGNAELTQSFVNLTNAIGLSANKMLTDLKVASQGTVSDMRLIEMANKALLMSVDPNALPKMMEAAKAAANAMKIDVATAFENITEAVAKQKTMMLTSVGIVMNAETAYEKYAKQLGKTSEELTDTQKKTAFLNETLRLAKENADRMGTGATSLQDRMNALKATFEDWKNKIIKGLLPVMETLVDRFIGLMNFIGALRQKWNDDWGGIRSFFENTVSVIISVVEWMRKVWNDNFLGIQTIIITTFSLFADITKTVFRQISGWVEVFLNALQGNWKGVWEGLKYIVAITWNTILKITETGSNAMLFIFNKLIDAINWVLRKMGSNFQIDKIWANFDSLRVKVEETSGTVKKVDMRIGELQGTLEGFSATSNFVPQAQKMSDAMEKTGKQIEKEKERIKKNLEEVEKTYEGVADSVKDKLRQMEDKHFDFVEGTKEKIKDLQKSLRDLEQTYRETVLGERKDMATSIVEQRKKVDDMYAELAKKKAEYAKAVKEPEFGLSDEVEQMKAKLALEKQLVDIQKTEEDLKKKKEELQMKRWTGADLSDLSSQIDLTEKNLALAKKEYELNSKPKAANEKDLGALGADIITLERNIEREKKALENYKEYQVNLQGEITRATDLSQKTEFEQRMADLLDKQDKERLKFEAKKKELEDELAELNEALERERLAYKNFYKQVLLVKEGAAIAEQLIKKDLDKYSQEMFDKEMVRLKALKETAEATVKAMASAYGGSVGFTAPRFAEGGVVYGPTPALIGERTPEVVLPLNRMGGGVIVNINNPTVSDSVGLDRLKREIIDTITRQQELGRLGIF